MARNNSTYRFLCLLPVVLALTTFVTRSQVISYNDNSKVLSVVSTFELFEDENASYSVSSLLDDSKVNFVKSEMPVPSYSFTESVIWCKFKLNNTTSDDCFLEISPPILNEVVLYQISDSKIDSTTLGSLHIDKNKTALKTNNYVFKLDDKANFYLLKVKTQTRLFINAHIGSYGALLSKTKKIDTLQGVYAGLIIMISIYNLFLFFTSKERLYLYYLLHLLNSAIFFLYVSGYGIVFFWHNAPGINTVFISVMNLGFILSLIFAIQFLGTKRKLPLLHKILVGLIIALIINCFVDVFISSHLSGKLLNYVGFAITACVIAGSVKLVRKGFKPAYTFLYAWLLYMAGVIIQTLQALNFIPTSWFSSNAIQVGSAFEIVLLSIAVGNKISFYKEKKKKALISEKALLEEKDSLKSNQKEQLEQQLQEQTELLYAKNKELKRRTKEIKLKNKEISLQNKTIKEYHLELEEKNKIITEQNKSLTIQKENLEHLIEERTSELKKATERAEKADQLKTAFLKDFSHEIRTPMNAISGFSSLLMDIDVEDESHDYYAEIINIHTDSLLELIDDIVDLSRIQTNSLYLKNVKFDPVKMFNAMFDKMQAKLKREKKSFVELNLNLPENKDIRFNLDYNRFWKVLNQLVDNSIKHTDIGHIEFGYKQIEDSKNIEVFVKDTGVGIKKEKLNFVFDSFRKIEEEDTKFHSGIGLGLSLVKGLVTHMKGKIDIETISAKESDGQQSGTTIRVMVPKAIV